MIDKTEQSRAKQMILSGMSERLLRFGFDPKPSGQSFYRKLNGGTWAFHLAFIPHKQDMDLTADVALRLDVVEELVNKHDTKRKASEKRLSMTLGGELGNVSQGRFKRWTVTELGDVPIICNQVADAFRTIGIPFLASHFSLPAVNRALVSTTSADRILAPLLGPRYMRALASSYLLGEDATTTALGIKFEHELAASGDLYLPDFRNLRQSLARPNDPE